MGYPGSKGAAGVAQRIISQFPPHRVYVEPFVGSGVIVLSKTPSELSVVVDLDSACVAGVVGKAAAIGFSAVTRSLLDLARLVYLSAPAGEGAFAGSRRDLVGVVTCGIQLVEAWTPCGDELVYCDPPYLVGRRGSPRRRYYRHEISTVVEHDRLISALRRLNCAVAISGYRNGHYDSRLVDWRRVDYTTSTRGGAVVESLWCNFPAPVVLDDARFFGGDRRRRQDWRRMVSRWEKKLLALDPVRRAALVAVLRSRF